MIFKPGDRVTVKDSGMRHFNPGWKGEVGTVIEHDVRTRTPWQVSVEMDHDGRPRTLFHPSELSPWSDDVSPDAE